MNIILNENVDAVIVTGFGRAAAVRRDSNPLSVAMGSRQGRPAGGSAFDPVALAPEAQAFAERLRLASHAHLFT